MRSVDKLFAHLHNVNPIADRVSPACDIGQVNKSAGTPGYEDPLYGNCWSWTPAHGAAVYGRTDDLPVGPLDELADGAFLRVPFRRVPVIEVRSIEEARAIAGSVKSPDPNFRGVWRGQSSHYTTEKKGRTKDELLRLYGTEDVDEPSLLPSAARTDLYFPDSFGAWSALLDLYVHERAREQGMQRELLNFVNSYRYRLWGFATAQHYGLPSVGLDVTHDIDVALLFALHTFKTSVANHRFLLSKPKRMSHKASGALSMNDLPRRRRGERASPHKMRNFRSGLETLSDFEMEFTSNARQYRGVRVDVVLGEEISTVERVVDIKISANTLALRIGPDFYQGVRR